MSLLPKDKRIEIKVWVHDSVLILENISQSLEIIGYHVYVPIIHDIEDTKDQHRPDICDDVFFEFLDEIESMNDVLIDPCFVGYPGCRRLVMDHPDRGYEV
jgi:hypothetical protein